MEHSATSVSESELAESSDEASTGEEAPLWIAKCNMQDIIETENRRQVAAPSKEGLSQGVESAFEMK